MEFQKPTDEQLHEFLMLKYIEYQMEQNIKKHNADHNSAVEEWEDQLRKISPDTFTRYLDDKGARHECSLCGESSLSVPEGMTINPAVKPEFITEPTIEQRESFYTENMIRYVQWVNLGTNKINDMKNKTYYMMHCLNCGNLSLIRSRYVIDWYRVNGREAEE